MEQQVVGSGAPIWFNLQGSFLSDQQRRPDELAV
jgi:hypothetical protein